MLLLETLTSLYLALDETPGDSLTLNALADAYEDLGDQNAVSCVRWTITRKKFPFLFRADLGLSVNSKTFTDGWVWWAVDSSITTAARFYATPDLGHPNSCRLPRRIWERLRHTFDADPRFVKEYPNQRTAYEALIDIWPIVAPLDALATKS
jgi:hypothetical protein